MTADARPLTDFLACLLGPAVWAAHLFIVYGAESVVCIGTSSPATAMRWTVVSATAAALAAVAVPFIRHYTLHLRTRRTGNAELRQFLRTLSGWLAAISAAAVLGTAVSALRLPACAPPFG